MPSINFVSQRLRKLSKLEKKDLEIFKISAIVTAVLVFVLLVISGYRFYLVSQLRTIETDQKKFLARIESQGDQEKSFVLFVNKLRVLSSIFQKRKNKQEAITYFSQIFGPDITIERLAYEADSQLLTFRILAADIFSLEKVFELLSTQQSTDKFVSLSKSGLQRTESGTYQMQVTVVVGEEEL